MKFKKYEPNELKHLQQIELKILKDIISICEAHDLKYYAYGGTTLGAVRHGGFIPWDDDVDIAMFREDYENLLKILDSELNEEYHVINFYTEPDCFVSLTQVSLKKTTFKVYGNYPVSFNQGIFIDIFPIDYVPKSKIKRKIYYNFDCIYYHLIINSLFKIKTSNKISSFAHLLIHNFLKIVVGSKRIIKQYQKYLTRYNNKKTNYCTVHFSRPTVSSFGKYGYWDKKDFEPSKKVKFEDIEINIPENYDKILTIYYGDYMTLPPEEKRYNHAPEILDFGKY